MRFLKYWNLALYIYIKYYGKYRIKFLSVANFLRYFFLFKALTRKFHIWNWFKIILRCGYYFNNLSIKNCTSIITAVKKVALLNMASLIIWTSNLDWLNYSVSTSSILVIIVNSYVCDSTKNILGIVCKIKRSKIILNYEN